MAGYNLKARISKLQELEARGVIKPEHKTELDNYRQQGMVPGVGQGGRVKTTPDDMKMLKESSERASMERDSLRTYAGAGAAAGRLKTGPMQAWWMDAITPEEGGGFWDSVGGVIGTPFRAMYSDQDWADRDHLKTVNAKVATAASQDLKGAASDRDMALLRISGIGAGKQLSENQRIIKDASYQSGLNQMRARLTSMWISRNGSVSNPDPNGRTFEDSIQNGERLYEQQFKKRYSELTTKKKPLPKAPPRKPSAFPALTIDINGNPIP